MKKRFMALGMVIIMVAVTFTVLGVKGNSNVADVSYAQRNTYGESETEKTTLFTNPVDNFIGDKVDGVSNAYGIMSDLAGIAGDIGGSVSLGSGGLGACIRRKYFPRRGHRSSDDSPEPDQRMECREL